MKRGSLSLPKVEASSIVDVQIHHQIDEIFTVLIRRFSLDVEGKGHRLGGIEILSLDVL